MKKILNGLLSFAAAAVMMTFGCSVSAESEYKVYDYADLLSDSEEAQLEEKCARIADTYGHDIIVYTTNTLDGYSVESYSELTVTDLGAGINGSGAIYVVSMEDRDYDIYAFGQMQDEILTDYIRNDLASELASYLTDAEYYTAFANFADNCEAQIEDFNINGPHNQEKPFGITEFLICLAIAFVIALIIVLILKASMKTTRLNSVADDYIREGSFDLKLSRDIFLYSTVTRVKRESSSGSGGGSSSGGHSSGKF